MVDRTRLTMQRSADTCCLCSFETANRLPQTQFLIVTIRDQKFCKPFGIKRRSTSNRYKFERMLFGKIKDEAKATGLMTTRRRTAGLEGCCSTNQSVLSRKATARCRPAEEGRALTASMPRSAGPGPTRKATQERLPLPLKPHTTPTVTTTDWKFNKSGGTVRQLRVTSTPSGYAKRPGAPLMRIASVGSAFPKHYFKNEVVVEALKKEWTGRLPNVDILDRLDESMKVEGRYAVEPIEFYENMYTWGQANNAWIKHALELGEKALCRALVKAGVEPKELSAIFVTSVTGIAAPSIDARLVNRMGLSTNIKRIPIFGLGCVAGAAGISRAADYVRGYPDQAAAVLSVELCSLTLQREDLSMAHLISALLFGDGAAAAVVVGAEHDSPGPEIVATKSIFYPNTERVMGWDISEKGFRIVLSPEVPDTVVKYLGRDADAFLAEHGLGRRDIQSWIMHTGGPKVLEATAKALDLTEKDLEPSWNCLRKVGNISSTSVLLVLEDVYTHRRPAPGSLSILAAMGPGFCSELVLLRW